MQPGPRGVAGVVSGLPLNDTIKCLNRKQKNALLHFRGDGTGEGVIWEVVERESIR